MVGISAEVYAQQAETLRALFDDVVLRDVDRMEQAVPAPDQLVSPGDWLASMTTRNEIDSLQQAAGTRIAWIRPTPAADATDRLHAVGKCP